jgi:hypothetical protein
MRMAWSPEQCGTVHQTAYLEMSCRHVFHANVAMLYTVVIQLLHCCYKFGTLLLHCSYIYVTLLSHGCYTVVTPDSGP